MNKSKKFPLKFLYLIIAISAAIILVASFEVLQKARSIQFYDSYIKVLKENGQIAPVYKEFLTAMVGIYFARIAVPIGLTFNAYYAHRKEALNKVFISGWSIFLIGSLIFTLLTVKYNNPYFLIFLGLYISLLLVMLMLNSEFNEKRKNRKTQGGKNEGFKYTAL